MQIGIIGKGFVGTVEYGFKQALQEVDIKVLIKIKQNVPHYLKL